MREVVLAELGSLRRFSYSLTGKKEDADDLLQAVVEKLLANPIPEDVSALPWMLRITKNIWIDELRARKIRGGVMEYRESSDQVVDGENETIVALTKQQILSAIQHLPMQQQVALNLAVNVGLSYSEIADVLEVPMGTVMSRIARARQELNRLVTREELRKPE